MPFEMLALRRLAAVSIMLFMTLPMAVQDASADGIAMGYSPNTKTWWLMGEDAQFAVINYDKPNETLLLQTSIALDEVRNASEMYWLVPIPSAASDASVGIFKDFPGFGGHYLRDSARLSITNDFFWIYSSQIYALPLAASTVYTSHSPPFEGRPTLLSESRTLAPDQPPGVDIFQRVVHYGLETELVAAENVSALEEYVSNQGIALPSNATPILQQYISEGYSFVASRIMDVQEFIESSAVGKGFSGIVYSLSVMVKFPSQRIFFPLRISSIYGSASIPTVVEVVDYCKPVPFSHEIPGLWMETDYLFQSRYAVGSGLQSFFSEQVSNGQLKDGNISNLEFTLVMIDTSAQDLDEDLWLEEGAPATVQKESFVREFSLLFTIPLFIGISMVSSLVGGSYVYRAYHPKKRRFLLLGVANAATLVGLALMARHLRIDETFVRPEKPEPVMKWKPFLVVFTLSFVLLSLCCHALINSFLL